MEMDVVAAVERMQRYIEDHINEKITLKQISEAAGSSPWHSTRIFKELVGKTLFDYIRAIRLTKAALMLRDEEHRIIDVAFDFVFDSHEGFTKAFSKEFGISPKQYSKETPPIQLFIPYNIRGYYQIINKGENRMSEKKKSDMVFTQIIERPERKVLLKRGIAATEYFEYCQEVGCDVWALLSSVKEALYEPIGMWLPKHLIKPGTSTYVQGVELPISYEKAAPEGYEIIQLPPCRLMVFQGPPYDDEHFMEEIAKVMEAIGHYDPTLYGYTWAPEEAPRFQLAPKGYRGYIEARPVKSLNQ